MRGWWLVGLLGCSSAIESDTVDTVPDTDVAADADTDTDTDSDTLPPDLNGTAPAMAVPAPEFVATNRDGTSRSRPDLIGHPTVVWFYPAAMTSG